MTLSEAQTYDQPVRKSAQRLRWFVDAFERQVKNTRRIPAVWDGLTAAAVVAYARCFTTGVRTTTVEVLLQTAPSDLIEIHGIASFQHLI